MQFLQIANMIVDVSRGHLHKNGQTLALEPKVLEVLLMLARHQGDVVTHQALLEEIWPRTVVENNALQRCIGQLRKALDDNGRDQRLIVTYPRKGYSLAEPVIWRESPEPPKADQGNSSDSWPFTSLAALAAGIAVALSAGIYLLTNADKASFENSLQATASQTETASDAYQTNGKPAVGSFPLSLIQTDFYAVYAPDSFLVAYSRNGADDGRQLWVRNVLAGSETRVSDLTGNHLYTAWSPDSGRLAYVHEDGCYSLRAKSISHDTEGAIDQGEPETLIDCQHLLLSPQWLSDTSIALIESYGVNTVVSRIDTETRKRKVIYQSKGKQPYHLSYSEDSNALAIAQYSQPDSLDLLMLSLETGRAEVLYSSEFSLNTGRVWHPVWNQDGTAVMISDQGKTLNIALDGTVSEQVIPYLSSQQGIN